MVRHMSASSSGLLLEAKVSLIIFNTTTYSFCLGRRCIGVAHLKSMGFIFVTVTISSFMAGDVSLFLSFFFVSGVLGVSAFLA